MQHQLGPAPWDADGVREYVLDQPHDEVGVQVLDETGDVQKGMHTVGVQRQYLGTAVAWLLTLAAGLSRERRPFTALAIAWSELVTAGAAARLKSCAEHTCGWAFGNVSNNRSRPQSMMVCGTAA
ncbi:transposase [Streptomyces sp. NPDC013457]|uniref:CGNR zinc finger domain-containing protein n=1 Tax=Streptomyces sp. NPDC013457 TaxID=3364866 RepID=UPI0036FACD97